MPDKVSFILFDSYIAAIKNSVGSNLFRNIYAKVNGEKKDVLKNGELSCAFYVSSILALFELTDKVHATVNSTMKDLEKSGWQKIKKPKIGSVLVWEEKFLNDSANRHIGFYLGNKKAISNDCKSRQPTVHYWTYGIKKGKPERKVEAIYWHKKLSQGQ